MRPIPVPGVGGAGFEVPAAGGGPAPDGTVVVRNQASDARDRRCCEVKEAYDQAIEEAGQRRPPVMPGTRAQEACTPGMMPPGSGRP